MVSLHHITCSKNQTVVQHSTSTFSSQKVNTTPLIFILSPGTDPVSDVITFADKTLGLGSGKLLRFQIVFFSKHQLILDVFFFQK